MAITDQKTKKGDFIQVSDFFRVIQSANNMVKIPKMYQGRFLGLTVSDHHLLIIGLRIIISYHIPLTIPRKYHIS
jgi:hypothetical protein